MRTNKALIIFAGFPCLLFAQEAPVVTTQSIATTQTIPAQSTVTLATPGAQPAKIEPMVPAPQPTPVVVEPTVAVTPIGAQPLVTKPVALVQPVQTIPTAQAPVTVKIEQTLPAPAVQPVVVQQPVPVVLPQQEAALQPAAPAAPAEQPMPESIAQISDQPEPSAATPEPTPEAPAASEPEEDLEIKGIDTVDLNEPQGNWLYKRIWWEKAERLYEKIKKLADQIAETRTAFFEERNKLDRVVLDPFYIAIGLKQGELLQMTSYFIEQMQEERKEMGTLNEQERDLLTRLQDERKTLEQLNLSVQGISNVDHAIDDALMKLVDQINLARQYEKNAWEQFKEINRELSDKKARERYYNMDSAWRNLNNINTYISDPFTQHFTQLIDRVNKDTEQVKSVIGSLKEKGIDIKEQAQKLHKSARSRREKPVEKPVEQEEQGWLGMIWDIVTAPFTFVWGGVTGVFDWIAGWFGTSEPEAELASKTNVESPEA